MKRSARPRPKSSRKPALSPESGGIRGVLEVMARLRAPDGCPWDREQTHRSLKTHAVEEVYELMDAIDAGDDPGMIEELGDVLLQVVFHCQLAAERGAYDFQVVCRELADKLVRRHPHVFGTSKAKTVDAVWAQWEKIKHAEKEGTRHARPSALDGIPVHLPALMRAAKLVKKAGKAGLGDVLGARAGERRIVKGNVGHILFDLARQAQVRGWDPEELLREETRRRERELRRAERTRNRSATVKGKRRGA